MDILTPKGQKTLEDEHWAAQIWLKANPSFEYVQTPKDAPAAVDALLVKNNVIRAVVEVKCRYDMTLNELLIDREGRWLVTFEKLLRGKTLSEFLCVPFLGFIYLVQDRTLLVTTLTNDRGDFIADMRITERMTQATVNGGEKRRTVALVDLSNSKVYKP